MAHLPQHGAEVRRDLPADGLGQAGPNVAGLDDAPLQIDLGLLPDDPAVLQRMLRDVVAAGCQRQAALQASVQEREAECDKPRLLIQRLLRHWFDQMSEQLDPDQPQLGLEDLEQAVAEGEAAQDAAAQSEERRRPRHGCRACEGAVVQAPAPDRLLDGGVATEGLVAHIVVAGFCDRLPLHR